MTDESWWADCGAGARLLVDGAPRSELDVEEPEEEAGQQGNRAADVDGQGQVDGAGVLHLDSSCDELCRSLLQVPEEYCPKDNIESMKKEYCGKLIGHCSPGHGDFIGFF